MKFRVFIDTSTLIYSFEFPNSNSSKVIELLNKSEIEAVISERVLKEITRYFERFYDITMARKFRKYIVGACQVIMEYNVTEKMNELKGKIKDKDLEQLAVTRKYGIKFLIAYDKDFEGIEEYVTPKKFIEFLGEEVADSDF